MSVSHINLVSYIARYSAISLFSILLLISAASGQRIAQRGGGGGGGGGTPPPTSTPTPNPLPQEPPAPGVIYRESFGAADLYRPTGGKGDMRADYIHTTIQGFWIEYPGSKDTQWITPDANQTWKFCASSVNPYEMFSPIQVTYGNGCVASEWFDPVTTYPAALMPVRLPTVPYELTLNGYPAPLPGSYLALGLTNSSTVYSNLDASGSVVLVIRPGVPYSNYTILYELRAGGMNGTLLASGETYFEGFNQMKLRIDPTNHTVGGSVNGTDLGTHTLDIGNPRYAGFEGVGIADNFVVTELQ